MAQAGLEVFAEIGLILFVFAFVLVLLRVWWLDGDEAERHAQMPVGDEPEEGPLP